MKALLQRTDAGVPARARRVRVLMLGTGPEGQGGIAAVVAALRQDGLFEREGVRYLNTHTEGSRRHKLGQAWCAGWRTALHLLRERPAIVHAHSASRASFYRKSILLWLARRSGARTIFHLHGAQFREFALDESGALARWWIRHTLQRSAAVIALSPEWAAFLHGFAPNARVHVVPNAVALGAAPAAAAETERVLFLGHAGVRKGLFELLQAVALLRHAYPALRLVVGGDGELDAVRRRCAELGIAGQVELCGWLDAAAKQRQLARAAIFCLPSHAEGLPMAMLEAMAAGRPVVVTPVGGILDAVGDHVNGLLVPPGDPAALARALAMLLDDAALRLRLGRNARLTVQQRFSTEVVAGKLAALYRALAGPAPR